MGIDLKYGKVTVENKNNIGEYEPVFLIRAKDVTSINALWSYLDGVNNDTKPEHRNPFFKMVRASINRFEQWQKKNETKIPD